MVELTEKRKIDKAELQRRIRAVQDLLLQDHMTADIINHCIKTYDVSDRQAYRYLWAANKFFEDVSKVDTKRRIAYYLQRKKRLLREMDPKEKRTPAGVQAANKVLDSMAKLEGVRIDTVKLIGDPLQPITTSSAVSVTSTIDYTKLPDEFLLTLWSQRSQQNG